jgi:hypothetical protein
VEQPGSVLPLQPLSFQKQSQKASRYTNLCTLISVDVTEKPWSGTACECVTAPVTQFSFSGPSVSESANFTGRADVVGGCECKIRRNRAMFRVFFAVYIAHSPETQKK